MIRLRPIPMSVLLALACCTRILQASALHVMDRGESVDAISGLHWRMVVDPAHPGAPPRLSLIHDATMLDERRGAGITVQSNEQPLHPRACVRAGDRILLRDAKAKVSAIALSAIALESGACGSLVRARVAATGGVVEMTVVDEQTGVLATKAAAWR